MWCALDECTCAVRVPSLCVGRATLPPANPLVKRVEVLVAALRDAFAKLDEVRVTTLFLSCTCLPCLLVNAAKSSPPTPSFVPCPVAPRFTPMLAMSSLHCQP